MLTSTSPMASPLPSHPRSRATLPSHSSQPRPRSLFTTEALNSLSSSLPRTSTLRLNQRNAPPGTNENLARRSAHGRGQSPPLPPLPLSAPGVSLSLGRSEGRLARISLEEEDIELDPPPAYTARPHSSEASVSFGPLRPWGTPWQPPQLSSSAPSSAVDLPPPPSFRDGGARCTSLGGELGELHSPPGVGRASHQQTVSDPLVHSRARGRASTTDDSFSLRREEEHPLPPVPPLPVTNPHQHSPLVQASYTLPWTNEDYDSDGSFHSVGSQPSLSPVVATEYRSPFLPPPSPSFPSATSSVSPSSARPAPSPSSAVQESTGSASSGGSGSWLPFERGRERARAIGLGLGLGWASSPSVLSSLPTAASESSSSTGTGSSSTITPRSAVPRTAAGKAKRPEVRVPPSPAWLDEVDYTVSPSTSSPHPAGHPHPHIHTQAPTAHAAGRHGSRSHTTHREHSPATSSPTSPRFALPPGAAPPSPMTAFPDVGWPSTNGSAAAPSERSVSADRRERDDREGSGWVWEEVGWGWVERERERQRAASGSSALGRERTQSESERVRERTVSGPGRDVGVREEHPRGRTMSGRGRDGREPTVRRPPASADPGRENLERRTWFLLELDDLEMEHERERERFERQERDDTPSSEPVVGRPLMLKGHVLFYPEGFSCPKCYNTGYKEFDPSHPCRKCWQKYGRPFRPPLTSAIRASTFQRPLPVQRPPSIKSSSAAPAGLRLGAWPESGPRGRFAGASGAGFIFPKAAPGKGSGGTPVVFPTPAPGSAAAREREQARERERERERAREREQERERERAREREEREQEGKCPGCDGAGTISVLFFDGQVCPTCRGTGMVFLEDGVQ
ncbi:hypothetical protein DACRYDRAFT_115186 [Dacryopinax primogenitus]|uniref:Uncharacterized protein n=1 Tax=Dacryopinax primogenitus (strain DJM 731) TaxID=1858805 RepID=M5GCH1_DACPD|nr:uncharacterized protein DACRYDRAFT_115186 [Dacryopinax primogenitus]EJU03882.1 hypothetical protein DACRYDRAFT_115186 [Dacryopinax primogenitus]